MIKIILWGVLFFTSFFVSASPSINIVSEIPKFALPQNITYTKGGKSVTLEENKVPFQSSNIEIEKVSGKELNESKHVIEEQIKKYPIEFIKDKINKIIVVSRLDIDKKDYSYYVGPNYIVIKLDSSFFGLKHNYSALSKSLHAAIGEMTLYKHHNYMMLFLFNGGEAPSKNTSYTMDELIKRGYVSDKGINTFDRYIAEYYKLIYTDPKKIISYASQSNNVRKRLCLAVAMYKQDDEKTLDYMTSHHITAQCQGKRFSKTISIDLSGS